MARTLRLTVVEDGAAVGQELELRIECIQEAITTFLTTRSLPLTLIAFLRCTFGFSTEEKAALLAMFDGQ